MRIRVLSLSTVLLGLLAAPGLASAKAPDIFPLAQVHKGQKGYGLTVFEGTKPERFEFEVLGVVKNALPKQDLILVTSKDPKIQAVGFARGMSGSPLYLDGKVACAFSYGFPFSKGEIGACTPIEYMIADGKRAFGSNGKSAPARAGGARVGVGALQAARQGHRQGGRRGGRSRPGRPELPPRGPAAHAAADARARRRRRRHAARRRAAVGLGPRQHRLRPGAPNLHALRHRARPGGRRLGRSELRSQGVRDGRLHRGHHGARRRLDGRHRHRQLRERQPGPRLRPSVLPVRRDRSCRR